MNKKSIAIVQKSLINILHEAEITAETLTLFQNDATKILTSFNNLTANLGEPIAVFACCLALEAQNYDEFLQDLKLISEFVRQVQEAISAQPTLPMEDKIKTIYTLMTDHHSGKEIFKRRPGISLHEAIDTIYYKKTHPIGNCYYLSLIFWMLAKSAGINVMPIFEKHGDYLHMLILQEDATELRPIELSYGYIRLLTKYITKPKGFEITNHPDGTLAEVIRLQGKSLIALWITTCHYNTARVLDMEHSFSEAGIIDPKVEKVLRLRQQY